MAATSKKERARLQKEFPNEKKIVYNRNPKNPHSWYVMVKSQKKIQINSKNRGKIRKKAASKSSGKGKAKTSKPGTSKEPNKSPAKKKQRGAAAYSDSDSEEEDS